MEQWTDQGIVLSARGHGEGGAVVSLLTEHNGRHAGYVHGAMSSKKRGFLQAGSQVKAQWSARVSDSLGTYSLEPEAGLPDGVLDDSLKLAALLSACSLCDAALPEREGHSGLYHGLRALFDIFQSCNHDFPPPFRVRGRDSDMKSPHPNPPPEGGGDVMVWGAAYVMWEISLLRELGFHLELDKCAGGGDPETLCYASPKTGRAVSKAQAAPYKEKLLELPYFLRPKAMQEAMREGSVGGAEDILTGLKMTGYFLEHWAFIHHTKGVPEPRLMFEKRFEKITV